MHFPTKMTVKVVDTKSNLPIPMVAIALTLFAKTKNNFQVGPSMTDGAGVVNFSLSDCVNSIRRAHSMFIMDYSGELHDCQPRLIVSLWPSEYVAKMIENYERSPKFWGQAFDDPETLFAELRMARNAEFEVGCVEVGEQQLLVNPAVVLPLRRK